jgi:hypothetical protein
MNIGQVDGYRRVLRSAGPGSGDWTYSANGVSGIALELIVLINWWKRKGAKSEKVADLRFEKTEIT